MGVQYFKVRGVRIEVLHAINSPSSYSPLFCIRIVILILIAHIYVRAHTHTHIYIWLLASSSHCFQLVFAPTLPCIPPRSCRITSFFPCRLSKRQQEVPLEIEAAELSHCVTPHWSPKVRNSHSWPAAASQASNVWWVLPRGSARSGAAKLDWASGTPVPNEMLRGHGLVKCVWFFMGIRVTNDTPM